MSYKINYGPSEPPKLNKRRTGIRAVAILIALAVFVMLAYGRFPEQTAKFYHNLFPWTRSEVREAFGGLRQALKNGETFSDAASAFCRDVLYETK